MKSQLISFLTALRFLTIIPLPWYRQEDDTHFSESVKFFIVVGLLIGALAASLSLVFSALIPHRILSLLALFFLAGISGFLHLDGLADTADGFFSSRPKEKILEIMRDSRIGAMGVILIFFILALKFAALASVATKDLAVILFFMPLAGRCAILLTMAFLPYAREEGGLGNLFYAEKGWRIPLFTLLVFFFSGSMVDIQLTCIVFFTLLSILIFFGIWCKRMIGGTTGDTLGAVCEITETGVAVFLACLLAG